MQVQVLQLIRAEESGTYEVLTEKVDIVDAIKSTEVNGLGVVPSRVSLANAEYEVPRDSEKEFILKKQLIGYPNNILL